MLISDNITGFAVCILGEQKKLHSNIQKKSSKYIQIENSFLLNVIVFLAEMAVPIWNMLFIS